MKKQCWTCKYRDGSGYCQNEKLAEDVLQTDEEKADMLIYSYNEGGRFWVGARFSCVHWSRVE